VADEAAHLWTVAKFVAASTRDPHHATEEILISIIQSVPPSLNYSLENRF
jgi:hypothetical protein